MSSARTRWKKSRTSRCCSRLRRSWRTSSRLSCGLPRASRSSRSGAIPGKEWRLGFAIVGFVVINGVLSFWQAYRAPSVDALIPALYLKGISTGDFSEALAAILGEGASGLSATNIVRLKAGWESDYRAWTQRDLSQKRYVYWWADGVYFNVRLDEERTCVLVLIGATEDGTKELVAVVDGYRESTQSWRELLQQLKRLGLSAAPKLAIGDGSLGFWIALQEEYGPIAQQRCWVHKTANILDKMPKSVQGKAKQLIHEMYLAPTRKAALAAYDQFISSYQTKFPKA